MDSNLSKILNIFLYALLGITVVLTLLFFNGGVTPESINSLYPEPVYTNVLLLWTFILFALAIIVTVAFAIFGVIKFSKNAGRSAISLVVLGLVVLVSYYFSDGTKMEIVGYSGADNVESVLKFTDTILFTTYVLFAVAVLLAFSSFLFKLRK